LALPGRIGFGGYELALDLRIQEIGEGLKGVGFSGLSWLKEKDPLRVGEEIWASDTLIRRGLRKVGEIVISEGR